MYANPSYAESDDDDVIEVQGPPKPAIEVVTLSGDSEDEGGDDGQQQRGEGGGGEHIQGGGNEHVQGGGNEHIQGGGGEHIQQVGGGGDEAPGLQYQDDEVVQEGAIDFQKYVTGIISVSSVVFVVVDDSRSSVSLFSNFILLILFFYFHFLINLFTSILTFSSASRWCMRPREDTCGTLGRGMPTSTTCSATARG